MAHLLGVTEPNTRLDTLRLSTAAEKQEDGSYRVSGQKTWITCAEVASKMMLLAHTTPLSKILQRVAKGFLCSALTLTRQKGGAVAANEGFFENYHIPASSLISTENKGFKVILHDLNAERGLLAGEALGLEHAGLAKASAYARDRVVFERPIGENLGIAHPLADAYMRLEAAKLATYHATRLYDASQSDEPINKNAIGVACNSAKYLAAEAAFNASEKASLTHGGMGYAAEYDVERWCRECLVPRIAPVSREMILNYVGEKALGLPRSY